MMELSKGIIAQLELMASRLDKINEMLTFDEVLMDEKLSIKLSKEQKTLNGIVDVYSDYKTNLAKLDEYKDMKITDRIDTKNLALEAGSISQKINENVNRIAELLSKMQNEYEKVVVEISALTHKNENLNFCFMLLNSYKKLCEKNNFQFKIIELNNEGKGIYFCKLYILGDNVEKIFMNENGIHQEILLNSLVNVQVLSYGYDYKQLPTFNRDDLKIDVFRSNGAGGQNINKVSTAIRITHKATGIVVTCQDERSQFQNRERAIKNIKEKVLKYYESQVNKEQQKAIKKSKTKIDLKKPVRIYNYKEDVITDLVGNQYSLQKFIDGDFMGLINLELLREK